MNISFMLATVVVQHQTLMLMIKPHHRQASKSEAKGTNPHITFSPFPIAPHLPRLTGKSPRHQVGATCRAEQPREERVQLRGVE